MSPRTAPVVVPLLAALVSACTPPPDLGDAGPGDPDGGVGCLEASLGPVTFNFQDDVSTHYQAEVTSSLDGAVPDYLVLQFFNYNERIGSLGVGTFPLDDEINDNYGHCAECLMVFVDQLTTSSPPQRLFFQASGTITLEKNPREGADLFGRIDDLVLVESTIGGEALESAPVPGGDCLTIGDVELAVKFVPDGWTCEPERYNGGDGVCDCACGVADADCFPNFDAPPPTTTTGCGAEQVCAYEGCRDACDAFADVGCPTATDVCTFAEPIDYCVGPAVIDPAALGEACSLDQNRTWCAVENTVPRGVCEIDFDGDGARLCRPRCAAPSDCAVDETCTAIVYALDGSSRGYCAPPEG